MSSVVSISVPDCVVGRVGHLDSTGRVPTPQGLDAFVSRLANHVLQTLVNGCALVTYRACRNLLAGILLEHANTTFVI